MNSNTDLTLFWLAWQKTCSIRLCCAGHDVEYSEKCSSSIELMQKKDMVQDLAGEVMKSMNRWFCSYLKVQKEKHGARLSNLDEESASWEDRVDSGSAFELIESYLYERQTLKGKAFKSYLFENVAMRSGGINQNLYGYLKKVMGTIIVESFGENVYRPLFDDKGNAVEPKQISVNGTASLVPSLAPDVRTEVAEVKEAFKGYLANNSADWDSDHWLILYCILNLIRVGSVKIQGFFNKGHQTINVWATQMKSELLSWLRAEGFSDKAIGISLDGTLQQVLDDNVCKKAWYTGAKKILEENRKTTGK